MNIGQLIRQQRKIKGLTQEELGKLIGVSKMAISKYERNIIDNMGRDKIISLSNILNIPIISFLEEIDKNEKNMEQITRVEFANKVKSLLSKTTELTEQQKQHLISTIDIICTDEK